jgi:hypothetical protein
VINILGDESSVCRYGPTKEERPGREKWKGRQIIEKKEMEG